MSITAQAGVLGFGIQAGGAKGGSVTNWYKHRSADIDLAVMDDARIGPPEIGGVPTPTIPYKAGVAVSGGATIYPRLENTFGWLLLCALGDCSTIADKDIDGADHVGLYAHTFKFKAGSESFVPYMGFRKVIPHSDHTKALGEQYNDAKLVGLSFNLPNDGLISARVDALGRDFLFKEDPLQGGSPWTFANASYEDYQSIPIGCVTGGSIVPTPKGGSAMSALPVVGATVAVANTPLDMRQEKVYGDPRLQDVTVIGRAMTLDLMVKWDDPDLYQRVVTGSASGLTWSANPFVAQVVVSALSPGDIGAAPLDVPYRIRLTAAEVMLQLNGGIRLMSNQAVAMRFTGTAIAPSTGEYATIEIQNTHAAYALP
jgi:hypothetical protein